MLIRTLTGDVSAIYEQLVPPEERDRLAENAHQTGGLITSRTSFIAYTDDTPVGILQADLIPSPNSANLHSLYVAPEYRRHHIAFNLLTMGVEEMRRIGAPICTLAYTREDPDTPILEDLLKRGNWQGPRPFMKRCYFDPTFDAPWMHLRYRLPAGFEIFYWRDLTENDRASLQKKLRQNRIPEAVSPFQDEANIEYLNSLGLRREGEVVGWMISHRLDANTVRYSSIFVEHDLQQRGIILKLVVDCINLHRTAPTNVFLEVPYLLVSAPWIHFINKHVVPYAYKVRHVLQQWV